MRRKLLLVCSIVCLLLGAIILFTIPAFAGSHGGTINKSSVDNGNGTITSTITVTNADANGDKITVQKITDTIYHTAGIETSGDLVPVDVVLNNIGDSMNVSYTFTPVAGDPNPIDDLAEAWGIDSGVPNHPNWYLMWPDTIRWPIPELSAGILFGLGALGLGGFILIRRKQAIKT